MFLLVTRPEPDGERTAAALRALGHRVLAASLLQVEPVAGELGEGPWAALALTSVNAVRAIASHPGRARILSLPAFAVGGRTAAAARSAGFSPVASAEGTVEDLARLIAARLAGSPYPLLYLAAQERSGDLAGLLAPAGIRVQTVVVYRTAEQPDLPAEVCSAVREQRLEGVLHFSARSAGAFVRAIERAGLAARLASLRHFCISQQAAVPLIRAGAEVRVAARPDQAAMVDLLNYD